MTTREELDGLDLALTKMLAGEFPDRTHVQLANDLCLVRADGFANIWFVTISDERGESQGRIFIDALDLNSFTSVRELRGRLKRYTDSTLGDLPDEADGAAFYISRDAPTAEGEWGEDE